MGQTTGTWSSTSNLHIYGRNRSPIADHGSSTGIFMGSYLYYSYLSWSTDHAWGRVNETHHPQPRPPWGSLAPGLSFVPFLPGQSLVLRHCLARLISP